MGVTRQLSEEARQSYWFLIRNNLSINKGIVDQYHYCYSLQSQF